jgi:hypothetical protein
MTDFKALKKLADACRKAGIKHYKNGDLEFTLSDDPPVSNYKRRTQQPELINSADSLFQTDTLTEEQLMFYSAIDPTAEGS